MREPWQKFILALLALVAAYVVGYSSGRREGMGAVHAAYSDMIRKQFREMREMQEAERAVIRAALLRRGEEPQ